MTHDQNAGRQNVVPRPRDAPSGSWESEQSRHSDEVRRKHAQTERSLRQDRADGADDTAVTDPTLPEESGYSTEVDQGAAQPEPRGEQNADEQEDER
jgi:hypothetical protein